MSKNHLPAFLCGIVFSISAGVGSAEDSAVQGKGQIDAKSFRCITEMTHVRQFYVDNLLGNLDATLAVANSATGGTYPPGSVIQLVPGDAMVKRDKGFNAVTHDWEFFELDAERKFEKGDLPKWSIALAETWLSHSSPSAVGSRVRDGPRLRSNSRYARHEWRFTKNRSPLQDPDSQPRGCRSTKAA
jgi:hypothetical protein